MSVSTYDELADHVGHKAEVVQYADGVNIAIECVTCGSVLLDFDRAYEGGDS